MREKSYKAKRRDIRERLREACEAFSSKTKSEYRGRTRAPGKGFKFNGEPEHNINKSVKYKYVGEDGVRWIQAKSVLDKEDWGELATLMEEYRELVRDHRKEG